MIQHSQPKRILAVDGGGSKTLCWVGVVPANFTPDNPSFEIVGRGQSGPSNPRSVGFDQAFTNIESAMRDATQQSNASSTSSTKTQTLDAACISLAGAGRTDEQQRVREWAEQRQWARQVVVADDVAPLRFAAQYEHRIASLSEAHVDSNAWNRSITLVAGTGSIAIGCDNRGNSARSGGWGYLLDDEGSGCSLGLAGLRSICDAHDQGFELSEFQNALMHSLKLETPTQLIGWIYQDVIPRPLIAELAPTVLAFADKDPIANKLTNDAVLSMAKNVSNIARRLGFVEFDYALAFSGGVFSHHPWLIESVLVELSKRRLSPQFEPSRMQPDCRSIDDGITKSVVLHPVRVSANAADIWRLT